MNKIIRKPNNASFRIFSNGCLKKTAIVVFLIRKRGDAKNRSGADGQVDLNPHVTLRLPIRENREGWGGQDFCEKAKTCRVNGSKFEKLGPSS